MAGYIQLLGAAQGGTNAKSQICTLAASMTPGNSVVVSVHVSNQGAGVGLTNVVDSRGNSYAPVVEQTASGPVASIWVCHNPATPLAATDTVTASWGTNSSANGVIVEEYTGITGGTDVTGTNGSGSGGTSLTASTSSTTTQANDIAVTACGLSGGSGTAFNIGGTSSSFATTIQNADTGSTSTRRLATGSATISSSGATVVAAWRWSNTLNSAVAVATFKTTTVRAPRNPAINIADPAFV